MEEHKSYLDRQTNQKKWNKCEKEFVYEKSIVKISLDWVLLGTPPTLQKCILEKNR